MRLTVLGKSPSWQDAGGACSGYLVEEGGHTVLVDCGNGVFAKLRQLRRLRGRGRRGDLAPPRGPLPRPRPVLVRAHLRAAPAAGAGARLARHRQSRPAAADRPAAARARRFRRVVGAWGNEDLIENAFEIEEYDADRRPEVGPMRFSLPGGAALHRDLRDDGVDGNGGGTLVYGADSSPTEELVGVRARAATCC